jgi:hypothetical protein
LFKNVVHIQIKIWVTLSLVVFVLSQLFNWALEPAEDVILDELFELGFQDAMAWVRKQEGSKQNLNGGTNGVTNGATNDVTNGASSAPELK